MTFVIIAAIVGIAFCVFSGGDFSEGDNVGGIILLFLGVFCISLSLIVTEIRYKRSDYILTPSIEVNCIDSVCDTTYVYKFYASEKE